MKNDLHDIPVDWETVALKDITDIRFSNVDKKTNLGEIDVTLCNYTDVYNNEYITDIDGMMKATASIAEIEKFKIYPGDVIITKDSETPFDIGVPTIVLCDQSKLLCGYHLALIRPNMEVINSIFLSNFLQTNNIVRYFSQMANGMTRYGLTTSAIENLLISTPPLIEQKAIAEILDTIDNAIHATEKLIEKLKAMKKGLLHDLLTRGLDVNGNLRDPIAHPEQFKDSELGRIPKEWEVKALNEFAEVKGGKRLPKNHNYSMELTTYRYLRVLDFFENEIIFDELEYLEKRTFFALNRYQIFSGNIFISIAGSIGYSDVYRPNFKHQTILTENAARIVINNDNYPEYISLVINSDKIQRQINAEKGTGGGVPKLALFRIENLRMSIAPVTEQKRITSLVSNHEFIIKQEEIFSSKSKQLKKGLMDDLLTGRVRVKV